MKDILQKLFAIENSAPTQLTESAVPEASNFDSKKISTGTVYSRKYDPETGQTTGTKRTDNDAKRGRGRPKKDADNDGEVMKPDFSAFGMGKTINLPKDKNARRIKGRDTRDTVDESAVMKRALDVIESAVMLEKEMTDAQMTKREEIVKGMKENMAGFEKRYGKRAEAVMYATATKQAMAEGAHSYMPSGEEIAGKRPEDETVGDKMKKFVKKVANKVAPDDETLMKDLANKSQGVSEAAKPDFLDIDKDGDTKEDMKKAAADKKAGPKKGVNPFAKEEVKEACGDMPAATGDITISGSADALAMMLKMAGMPAHAAPVQAMHSMEEAGFNADGSYNTSDDEATEFEDEQEVDEWANSPAGVEGNEEYQGIEAAIPSGDDLHREKSAYPAAAGGDNPMAIDEEMWTAYQALKAELQ
mgnify:CR=1 FL=1